MWWGMSGRDRHIQASHDVEGLKIDTMHRVLREERRMASIVSLKLKEQRRLLRGGNKLGES